MMAIPKGKGNTDSTIWAIWDANFVIQYTWGTIWPHKIETLISQNVIFKDVCSHLYEITEKLNNQIIMLCLTLFLSKLLIFEPELLQVSFLFMEVHCLQNINSFLSKTDKLLFFLQILKCSQLCMLFLNISLCSYGNLVQDYFIAKFLRY